MPNRPHPTASLPANLAVGLALGSVAPAPVIMGVIATLVAIHGLHSLRARFQAVQQGCDEGADLETSVHIGSN